MADDLLSVLTKFHCEIVMPDVKRVVDDAVDGLRGEMHRRFDDVNGHFVDICKRLDRLENEYSRSKQPSSASKG